MEFAIVAPVLALALLGTADLAQDLRRRLVLDQTAASLAQVVTQYQSLASSDITTLLSAAQTIAGSVPVSGALGATIISCITNASGTPSIAWQKRTGAASFVSRFGKAGAVPTLPDGYAPPVGATLIATEVFTSGSIWVYASGLLGGSGASALSSYALFQPRLAPLSSVGS